MLVAHVYITVPIMIKILVLGNGKEWTEISFKNVTGTRNLIISNQLNPQSSNYFHAAQYIKRGYAFGISGMIKLIEACNILTPQSWKYSLMPDQTIYCMENSMTQPLIEPLSTYWELLPINPQTHSDWWRNIIHYHRYTIWTWPIIKLKLCILLLCLHIIV